MIKYKLIIVFVIIILLLSGCTTEDNENDQRKKGGGSYLEGITIGFTYYQSERLYLSDLGINKSTASKFDNNTLTLKITLMNNNTSIENHYEGAWGIYRASKENVINIDEPKTNYRYNLSFHYIINSPYPEIRDLTILGLNNYLNLSFILTENWNINITLDPEFSSFEYLIKEESGRGEIFITGYDENFTSIGHYCGIYAKILEID